MRIFIYKSIFISILLILIFKLTIGHTIKSYEKKFYENFDKQNVENIKEKIRKELRSAIQKDKMLNDSDTLLIKKFLLKIKNEISDD